MKIPKALKEDLSRSIPGKSKLRLFKSITGTDDKQPTNNQAWKYIEKVAEKHFPFAELFTYILTEGRYSDLDYNDIKDLDNVDGTLEELEKYPQKEPLLFEIKNFMKSGTSICAWVRCELVHDSTGHFYTIILFEEKTFPEKVIFYTEIRTSQTTPNPAVSFNDSNGEVIRLEKGSADLLSNNLVRFCLKLMEHIRLNNPGSLIPLDRIEKISANYSSDSETFPTDEKLMHLLEKLQKGETVCSIARVKLSEVIPFSYDYCFRIPLVMINHAERHLDTTAESGILVYWENNKFIMSDCYGTYLAARRANLSEITVVIVGDFPNDLIIKKQGGQELLPPLLVMHNPNYDSLEIEMKDLILQRYLDRLATLTTASDVINAKCLVLTEDSNTKLLENLLLANNFNVNETLIWSYKGCSNFVSLEATLQTIKKINPRIHIVVHRDRDYLSNDQVEQVRERIARLGGHAFLTSGTDIESYYTSGKHIHYLNPLLPLSKIEQLFDLALNDTKPYSLECMTKNSPMGTDVDRIYHSNKTRFSHGKKLLAAIQTRLQKELKKNPKVFDQSPFLDDASLQEVSGQIWG